MKKQFAKLDVDTEKLTNDALTADIKDTAWLDKEEPKFAEKKNTKQISVAYDTKLKKYIQNDVNVVCNNEPIKL